MLAVESVLALDHAGVVAVSTLPGGLHQSGGHLKIRHGGILDGGVLPAGMLKADGAGGDDDVAGLHIQMDAAAGAHPEEGIRADIVQLLHGDGGGGPADAGGADGNFFAQECAGIDGELPIAGDKLRIVKQCRYGLAAARIAGEDAIASHIAGLTVNVKLLFQFLHGLGLLL